MVNFNILRVFVFQIILYHRSTIAVKDIYRSPNVRTSLFTEIDIRRSCWNHEEINLLRSRMIMQDLIPNKVPRDIQYLVDYIQSAEEAAVTHSPEGNVRHIMMLALSDVLGGYLQSVAIPLAKENYYAGNIDYATMSKLYEMLNEIKHRLRTDGGRWSRPIDMNKFSVKVTALKIPMSDTELACKALFVIPEDKCAPGMPKIAVPYLDYDEKPGAVALPLKSRNLYSLKTSASSHIIVRFYILARQCLFEMPRESTDVFNHHFMEWLTTKVVPNLYDDIWYPGFGSVMRIVETVNETELIKHSHRQFNVTDNSLENSLLDNNSISRYLARLKTMAKYNTTWFLTLLFWLLFVVLVLLLFCCCCIWYSRTGGLLVSKSSSGKLNALMSVYCGLADKKDFKEDPNNHKTINYNLAPGQQTRPNPRRKAYKEDIDTSSSAPSITDDDSDSIYYVSYVNRDLKK